METSLLWLDSARLTRFPSLSRNLIVDPTGEVLCGPAEKDLERVAAVSRKD